ncbi:uncharacterized protein LOC141696002 [Apium graveolens]|uniref:uncharacterized protein LOC141696002 n=1 Tax=Apium graveolens TaxID=4045 RepID=UPI003D7992D1
MLITNMLGRSRRKIYGPELVQQMDKSIGMIKKRLIVTQDRYRKYADLGRRRKEFDVGDKAYRPDNRHILSYEPIEVQSDLTYEEQLVQTMDDKVRKLRNKEIKLVKTIWRNHSIEEATWELEEEIRRKYPSLFASNANSEDGIFKGEDCNAREISSM